MAYTTIDNPELYFQVKTYTGTGSSNAFTLDGDEDMQPNLVWIKHRAEAHNHYLYDSVRGVQLKLSSNTTAAEIDMGSGADAGLTAFGSDGFTIGGDTDENASGESFVAWCWKESADAGMDIVGYTGNGSNRTISHSLSAVPNWMILKNRDASKSWVVYHSANTSAPETEYLLLDGSGATTDFAGYFNDTAPTSSVFSVGTGTDANASGDDFIAYLWSEKQGFSKFGSFSGTGNADGAYVHLGFRPAMVILKRTSGTSNWYIYDSKRLGYNVDNNELYANTNNAEQTDDRIDFLSNGFKMRTSNATVNGTSSTLIFMAFAEAPFVNSNGVPCNAR